METALSLNPPAKAASFTDLIQNAALEKARRWLDMCYEFRKWEREKIFNGEATEQEKAEHKKALAMLVKHTRVMVVMTSDPEAFDSSMYGSLSCVEAQLRHSWDFYYNPPTPAEAAEAEALIARHFPG